MPFGPAFAEAVANDKNEVSLRNLSPGTYRLETRLPGSGWYVSAISLVNPDQKPPVRKATEANIARDGLALKSGDKVSGLTVTITEGAASIRGSVSVADGQRLPQNIRVYLVPAEREASENVQRFFEVGLESDRTFTVANIAPGRYWVIARPAEENDSTRVKLIRQNSDFRARVLREAESLKKEVSFKPCERTVDYDLQF